MAKPLQERLFAVLSAHRLTPIQKIGRGFAAQIHLAHTKTGKPIVIKIERDDSPRRDFTYKESEYLRAANLVKVGPKLIAVDFEARAILMEFIDGVPFGQWVHAPPSKKQLQKCIASLQVQVQKLDSIGLDHGQLGGRGRNILVKPNGTPVIIDFEKASMARKTRNATQLDAFLFKNPHSALAKTIKNILQT